MRGGFPEGLDVTPDGLSVFVANSGAASVQVISTATNTVTATIPTGLGSAPFAFGKSIGGGGSAPPPATNLAIPTLAGMGVDNAGLAAGTGRNFRVATSRLTLETRTETPASRHGRLRIPEK